MAIGSGARFLEVLVKKWRAAILRERLRKKLSLAYFAIGLSIRH
jgi:hypothetical protein